MSFSKLKKILEQAKNMVGGKLETQFQGKVYCPAPDKPNPDRCMLTVADDIGELIAEKNSVYIQGRQKENQVEQFKFTPETKAMYCSKKGERGRCWLIVNKLEEEPLIELREELREELEKLRGREILDPETQIKENEEEIEFNEPEPGSGEALRWGKTKKQKTEPKTEPKTEQKPILEEIKPGIKIERSLTGKKLDEALEQYMKQEEERKRIDKMHTDSIMESLAKNKPKIVKEKTNNYRKTLKAFEDKFINVIENEGFRKYLDKQEYEIGDSETPETINGLKYFRDQIRNLKIGDEDEETLTELVQQFGEEFNSYIKKINIPKIPSQIKREKIKSKKSRIEQIKKELKKRPKKEEKEEEEKKEIKPDTVPKKVGRPKKVKELTPQERYMQEKKEREKNKKEIEYI